MNSNMKVDLILLLKLSISMKIGIKFG